MSSISSLTSQTDSSGVTGPQQSLDKQIQALEKRIKDAGDNGAISQAQADDLTQQLDTIQKNFDNAATSGTVSPSDYRQIQRQLHQIARTLLEANRATVNDNLALAAMQGLSGGAVQPSTVTDPLFDPSPTTTDPLLDPNSPGGVDITV
jgi:outer membrane protein TolC